MSDVVDIGKEHWAKFPQANQYSDRIWIGGCLAAEPELLLSRGITAVCNLTEDDFMDYDGFKYIKLGQFDGEDIPNDTIQKFLAWMDEIWEEGHTCMINCHAGISRTPSFLIAWLMHRAGCNANSDLKAEWSAREDKIRLTRPIIIPHYKLKNSILKYFQELPCGGLGRNKEIRQFPKL